MPLRLQHVLFFHSSYWGVRGKVLCNFSTNTTQTHKQKNTHTQHIAAIVYCVYTIYVKQSRSKKYHLLRAAIFISLYYGLDIILQRKNINFQCYQIRNMFVYFFINFFFLKNQPQINKNSVHEKICCVWTIITNDLSCIEKNSSFEM